MRERAVRVCPRAKILMFGALSFVVPKGRESLERLNSFYRHSRKLVEEDRRRPPASRHFHVCLVSPSRGRPHGRRRVLAASRYIMARLRHSAVHGEPHTPWGVLLSRAAQRGFIS